MPKERDPPDKEGEVVSGQKSRSTEATTTEGGRKRGIWDKWQQSGARKTHVLPSNLSAGISAQNMREEILGKCSSSRSDGGREVSISHGDSAPSATVDYIIQAHHHHVQGHPKWLDTQESGLQSERLKAPQREGEAGGLAKLPQVPLPPPPTEPQVKRPVTPQAPPEHETRRSSGPGKLQDWELVKAVEELLRIQEPMQLPSVRFDISPQAAEENFQALKWYQFDLEKLLSSDPGGVRSVTSMGSEFKKSSQLEGLLGNHPKWGKLQSIIDKGSRWPLEPITEKERVKDVEGAIRRGNHKSAQNHRKFLTAALEKEVKKGWELLVPIERAREIPQLAVFPLGVAEQLGVSNSGKFVPKLRVTHDLSFIGDESESSVNSRVIEEGLEPCMFGHALLRVIHRIVHLRRLHPSKTIWIRKEDIKSAYRRVHLHPDTAVQAATQAIFDGNKYLLIPLRLPFGGGPCPSEFCVLSDVITDTTNDLLACKEWVPGEVRSGYTTEIPAPRRLPTDIPFAQALPTSVEIEEGDICKADVFIDDLITVGVDVGDNLQRIIAAPCTIMHAIAHKAANDTSVPRQNFIAEDKNEAEGAPEEVKITLGWNLDTRRLLVSLPEHKYKAWSSQLKSFQNRKSANAKDLQSILGRLENVAIIIPMMGHFLNNIRQLEIRATASGRNQIINKRAKDDFILAQSFLDKAFTGVSMNSITFRTPSKKYINDASEYGLGGFATHGRAWAWEIPEALQGRAHINLLEFLAQLISIWIDKIEGKLEPLDCILGMGDNTASMGWLRRSNFRERDEQDVEWLVKQKVARKLASIVLEAEACLYRQWFKGADNVVADSLSRDAYYLNHETHKQFLLLAAPTQTPSNLQIRPVPSEIICFVSSMLLLLPVKQQRLHQRKPSDLARSKIGVLSSLALELKACTWKDPPNSSKISSCPHSPRQSERLLSLQEIESHWWRAQSKPPSHMWLRPSGLTTGLTQDWTLMEKCASSSKTRCEGIAIKMAPGTNKKYFL